MTCPEFLLIASQPPQLVARRGRQGLSKTQLRRVMEHLEANLDQRVAVADLAAVAGVSTPHLAALFRRTTGYSVHQFIMKRRVDCALEFLRLSGLPIAEVALSCGFTHQSHMSRWMKRFAGVTPRSVRRQGVEAPGA